MARSYPLAALAPLAGCQGVRLISLQKGFGVEQIATLSPDLPARHGCALGVDECVLGLADAGAALDGGWHDRLVDVVPRIEKVATLALNT